MKWHCGKCSYTTSKSMIMTNLPCNKQWTENIKNISQSLQINIEFSNTDLEDTLSVAKVTFFLICYMIIYEAEH